MDIYDTNALVGFVPNLLTSKNFILDRYFPNIVEADTEFVTIDVDIGKRRMSPFVSPLVEGKLVESRRYQANTFKPPYLKDKRAPDLRRPVRRMMGERIAGSLSAADRELANLQYELADQIDMLNRRLEWMAVQALMLGQVTVEGDGFPIAVINFGRDPLLTTSLIGTASAWDSGNAAVSPSANIESWTDDVLLLAGASAVDILFSPTAWRWFKADPAVRDAIVLSTNNFRGGPNTADVNLGAQVQQGGVYKGNWGQYNLYVYNDWYVDANNIQNRMIPDGSLIITGPDLMGIRAFGMIEDPAFAYGPMAYAPKSWVSQDPAQRYMMMQSAPLMIPSRVNASFFAQVATGVNL